MKLGKKPAIKNSVSFRFRDYLSLTQAPLPPKTVNHEKGITNWGMLGNDNYGDCVFAGAGHETIAWNKTAGKVVTITDGNALSDYSAVTGFNPNNPNSDQGTDMQAAASYRRKTGIISANGRHKVAAYLAITPGNRTELKLACYLFEAVGIGIQFPASAMDQFNAGHAWTVVRGAQIEGGHYIPMLGYNSRYIYIVTWGKVQKMSWAFFDKYCDEAIVYLSEEMLTGGKSIEGFDEASLRTDLVALK